MSSNTTCVQLEISHKDQAKGSHHEIIIGILGLGPQQLGWSLSILLYFHSKHSTHVWHILSQYGR